MREKEVVGGRLGQMLLWPVAGFGGLFLLCVILWLTDVRSMWIPALLAAVLTGVSIWFARTSNSQVMKDMQEFAARNQAVMEEACLDLELPYAITDGNGDFLWKNHSFEELCGETKNLAEAFPELTGMRYLERSEVEDVYVESGSLTYRLASHLLEKAGENVPDSSLRTAETIDRYAVYLYDETDRIFCEEEMEREKMVAGLIYLDNYEEALAATDEVRRSLLVALIDRKITKYFESLDAVVRKTEKDRYFVVMKQKFIQSLKENHFSILEEVKATNLGNDMTLTLSIGMGMNGGEFTTNFEYARMAMDMALGRGGDQAVVKDGDRIQYFGGRSMTGEKTTRVKARVKAHALRELVENKEQILVMGHKLGDIDCFGAAIGIFRAMSEMGKKTHIVINDITSSVRPFKEEFETREYPEDMFVTGEEALTLVDENTVLVVVDVNRVSITEEERLLSMAKTIVVLDHHRQTSEVIDNAVLSYVEPFASSACELVAEILQYISDTSHLRIPEANALYAGIVLDTNNFTTQTGVRTFEAAAFLRRNGADVVKVRKLFRDNMTDYKAKAAAVHNAEVFCDHYAISICPAAESESPTIIGAQAANELLNIIGIKASIVLTEYNNKVYVSARSIDEVNVQMMMERLGGGGHMTTAGAQLTGCSVEDAKELVKETVKQMLEEGVL